mmetsp:Transcript_12501/g.38170  ORF Transcript_12501/g.38170 Transcript_12501/m.38170 type:complete len:214 (+) Transcript_12501:466-1107(+)
MPVTPISIKSGLKRMNGRADCLNSGDTTFTKSVRGSTSEARGDTRRTAVSSSAAFTRSKPTNVAFDRLFQSLAARAAAPMSGNTNLNPFAPSSNASSVNVFTSGNVFFNTVYVSSPPVRSTSIVTRLYPCAPAASYASLALLIASSIESGRLNSSAAATTRCRARIETFLCGHPARRTAVGPLTNPITDISPPPPFQFLRPLSTQTRLRASSN